MKQILFIEDNVQLCQIYSQVMELQDDIAASYVHTRDEILKALTSPWDLVVSDCDIPGIALDEIRALTKCKLVFLTGASDTVALKPGEKIYQKQNLIQLLPRVVKENT